MELNIAHSQRKSDTKRLDKRPTCVFCNRGTSTGKEVPGIGVVGPDCQRHIQALPEFLEALGMPELSSGALTVECYEATDNEGNDQWVIPRGIVELSARAEKSGLYLERDLDTSSTPWEITVWLVVSRTTKGRRKFAKSFKRWLEDAQKVVLA